MRRRYLELGVGVFIVAGVVALFMLALQVSGISSERTGETYTITARFDSVSGLQERAKVTTAGVVIGRVAGIRLDPSDYRAVVTMAIRKDVDYLSTDTIAAIQTAGVLGEKYVALSIGADEETLSEGDEITDTASAVVLEELIGKVMSALTK
jgi:phospholipid/cholesterol/gamma-HCH transport system substrate-binding protein